MMENLNKLYVSKTLKYYNRRYRRNYTLDDLAVLCVTSRQTLVRLSGASNFDLVKRVIFAIYGMYQHDILTDYARYEVACFDIMQRLVCGCDD